MDTKKEFQSSNVPSLPTYEEIGRALCWEDYVLDVRKQIPETLCMFEFNGVPFSTLGGIQALTGPKKNGKTWVGVFLSAAALSGNSEHTQNYLGGLLQTPDRTRKFIGHDIKELYIDTEQEEVNAMKTARRIHWLCGWDMDVPNERFKLVWLRSVEKDGITGEPAYERRKKIIWSAIENFEPDLVFIDGIRDIIGDFNNQEKASELIQGLMALAQKRNICIWCTLHLNPRPGNDDESKMRGHLGTELGNKVSDTLACFKQKIPNAVTFTVKQQDARGKDIEDFKFEITDDAGMLGIPKIIGHAPIIKDETVPDSDEDILKWLNIALTSCEWPMSRNQVKEKVFKKIGGQTNTGKLQADVVSALKKEFLVETTIKGKGGSFLVNIAEDLPF